MAQTTTFSNLRLDADIATDDTDNFAMTAVAKDSLMKRTINGDSVIHQVVIVPITIIDDVYTYPLDDSYDYVYEMNLIFPNGPTYPLDRNNWEFLHGNIIIKKKMVSGTVLSVRARQKLYDYDVFDEFLTEYIIHMFIVKMLETLASRKTGRFLRNNTTMAELMTTIGEHKTEAMRMKKKLPNRHDVRL
jgi:hypothetical protein